MLAMENEEQAQEKMFEQFEQSLEHLDGQALKAWRFRQFVIAQFHLMRNLHLKVIVRGCVVGGCSGARVRAFGCGCEHKYLGPKLTWVYIHFYSVKLLKYSDLGAK